MSIGTFPRHIPSDVSVVLFRQFYLGRHMFKAEEKGGLSELGFSPSELIIVPLLVFMFCAVE